MIKKPIIIIIKGYSGEKKYICNSIEEADRIKQRIRTSKLIEVDGKRMRYSEWKEKTLTNEITR